MSVEALVEQARSEFAARFGRPAQYVVSAPGRVNLIGEHIDYNDGFVLPMAIERRVVLAADRVPQANASSAQAQLYSLATQSTVTIDLTNRLVPGDSSWAKYPRGVLAGFQELGVTFPSFDAVLASDVPLGGGLSSSAALEVATATLLEELTEHRLDPLKKILLCQLAEQQFARVPCGIMDQYVSVAARAGHALFLDCRTNKADLVPFQDPSRAILIMNSNVHHELSGSEYGVRRQQCENAARIMGVASLREANLPLLEKRRPSLGNLHYRRARHVITEIERTAAAAAAIRAADWNTFGQLMYASHASLRDDYEVSCREIDTLVELAERLGQKQGVFGCRITGGGFGGCAVALIQQQAYPAISEYISTQYGTMCGRPLSLFISRPAGGADTHLTPAQA